VQGRRFHWISPVSGQGKLRSALVELWWELLRELVSKKALAVGGFCFLQAAIRCLAVASALVPMAQIKPSSSRPSAVTIFLIRRAEYRLRKQAAQLGFQVIPAENG
jgi:hypothetical protein